MNYKTVVTYAENARKLISKYITKTPLEKNDRLSEKYSCNIWIKREDLQVVRSFKVRGALNKMLQMNKLNKESKEFVCASAGNHAQGVAYSCNLLKRKGIIFMPSTTSEQKKQQVLRYGKKWVRIELYGDNFDACLKHAYTYQKEHNSIFIHPFDDINIMSGQGTVGLEVLEQAKQKKLNFDYAFVCVGGGGFASGISSVFKQYSPKTKIIGCEPKGAAAMFKSLQSNKVVRLKKYDNFVDGAAVATVGEHTFSVCKKTLHQVVCVPEGHICTTLIDLYNQDAIVAEPAGTLAVAGLDLMPAKQLKNKNICIILSGGNNDIMRMPEIKERSLLHQGLKYYFIVDFPQRPGALRDFLVDVLEPSDDITFFEYIKKTNREKGPALVGIQTKDSNQYPRLEKKLKANGFSFQFVNHNLSLFNVII